MFIVTLKNSQLCFVRIVIAEFTDQGVRIQVQH